MAPTHTEVAWRDVIYEGDFCTNELRQISCFVLLGEEVKRGELYALVCQAVNGVVEAGDGAQRYHTRRRLLVPNLPARSS